MAGIEEELQGSHYRALNPVVKCQAVVLLLHCVIAAAAIVAA
jgi:hypothetical protein